MPATAKFHLVSILSRPWLPLAWLALILCSALWVALLLLRGYAFDTSILALLPASQQGDPAQRELTAHVDEHLSRFAAQRMLVLVSHPSAGQSAAAAGVLAERLEQSGLFADLQGRIDAETGRQWQRAFFPYRYALMTEQARIQLEGIGLEGIEPSDDHPLLQEALARLYSPMASTVGPTLLDDPLQLFFSWQLGAAPRTPFSTEDGWLTQHYEGRVYRLLVATLAGNPYELEYQARVQGLLREAEAELPPDAQLLSSGLLIHAAYGAEQARREISTIGLGSLLGIAALLLYCFRRARYLLLAFLPIACGWLFALAVSMALFDALHLVTLAFGASLIGVAIDYALHYLCARQEADQAGEADVGRAALVHILPAVSLGLVSSALAYAAQGAAPFPGLRQMAVFSVCGLLGAWLTVLLWLPRLSAASSRTAPVHRIADIFARLLARWPGVGRQSVAAALLVFTALCLYQLSRIQMDDDLRRLQTSPPELLAADAQVQTLARAVNPSQYFLVSADSEQSLLELESSLHSRLRDLVEAEQIYDFQAVSKWLPPLAVQQENLRLNRERVFAGDGLAPLLAARLGSPQLGAQMQDRFEADGNRRLGVADWLSSEVGRQQSQLWLGSVAGQYHSLVMVAGIRDQGTVAALSDLAAPERGIRFVDKVAEITGVLKEHRRQLQYWILFAYAAVFLVLAWRYGLSAWRIVAAPAIASLATLAILSWLGLTINIFSLLALLLVLGIGLDAGIFLRESARSRYTWTAVTLAACTTLLAFGLLALSKTPVLQQFGSTLVVGIVGVWCLAPCFIRLEVEGIAELVT